MYSSTRVTDAAVEPVTLTQAKSHCRVEVDNDDPLIGLYITAARQYCEEVTGRAFLKQTWKLSLDRFPAIAFQSGVGYGWNVRSFRPEQNPWQMPEILLPRPRLLGIASITYLDSTGTQQTVPSSNYLVDAGAEPAKVMLAPGRFWPVAACVGSSVQVTYTAGYGETPEDVPATLRMAILMLVGHWYENREATVLPDSGTGLVSIPLGVADLLSAYTLDIFTLES